MKCRGIEIRPLEYSGCAGGLDCPTCKGTGEMQLCGHTVFVQDPDDKRQRWRWECQRLKGHTGEHASTNRVRTFVWSDDDEIIPANAGAVPLRGGDVCTSHLFGQKSEEA